jgi:hypothetical protein
MTARFLQQWNMGGEVGRIEKGVLILFWHTCTPASRPKPRSFTPAPAAG